MKFEAWLAGATMAACGLWSSTSLASVLAPLPPDYVYVHAEGGKSPYLSTFGAQTGSGCDPKGCLVGEQFSIASASATPAVEAVGLETDPNFASPRSDAQAFVQYYYQVIGSAPFVEVPVTIHGAVSAVATGSGFASASISGPFFNGVSVCVGRQTGCPNAGADSAVLNTTFNLPSNTIGSVMLSAIGQAGGVLTFGAGSYSAYADPLITIDPGFLAQNPGYSLVFSPNLLSSAPEPSAWALMLVGFGGLGAAMRSSRRRRVAAGA